MTDEKVDYEYTITISRYFQVCNNNAYYYKLGLFFKNKEYYANGKTLNEAYGNLITTISCNGIKDIGGIAKLFSNLMLEIRKVILHES
jgi:hypothetical protein